MPFYKFLSLKGQTLYSAEGGGAGGGQGGNPEGGQGGQGGNPEGGQGGGNPEGGSGGAGNQSNSLEELMKDPTFKAQYEAKMKEQLGNRLKKFEGVDVDEYKRLKEEEDKKKQDEMTEAEKLQAKIDKMNDDLAKAEISMRDVAIKEYAIAQGMDSKLVSRLIDASVVKRGESGNFEGIEEAVKTVTEEFPQLFQTQEGGQGGQGGNNNQGGNFKLPNQKGNPPTNAKGYDKGKALAESRHKKQEK